MNVLYTCDDNYIWLMGISMISLFENNKDENEINVYLLGDNISDKNKEILRDLVYQYKRKCEIIDVAKLEIPEVLYSKRWPKSAFSRLYAGELLPADVDKVLYLDCDTVVTSPIRKMYENQEDGMVISGVKDCIGKAYRRNIGLSNDALYINAGVLLINVALLRKIDISSKVSEFINAYGKMLCYADQDVLNGIFEGNFGVIPAEYNAMTLVCLYKYDEIMKMRHPVNYYNREEIVKSLKKPIIIHYTTCLLIVRPWIRNSDHPYREEFLKYKVLSPWRERELVKIATMKNKKDMILKGLLSLPGSLKYSAIGLAREVLLPMVVKIKAKK